MELPLLLFCLCLFPLLGQTHVITHKDAEHSFTIDSDADLALGSGRTDASSQYLASTTQNSISPESLADEPTMVHHGLEALSGNSGLEAKTQAVPTANAPEVCSEPVNAADDSKSNDSEGNINVTHITRAKNNSSTVNHGHKTTNDTGLYESSTQYGNHEAESFTVTASSTVLLSVSETTVRPTFVNVSSNQDASLDNAENITYTTHHPDAMSSVLLVPSPTVLENNEWKLHNLTEDPLDRFDSARNAETASKFGLSSHNTSYKELLSNNAPSSNLSPSTSASTGANTEPTLISTIYRLDNFRLQKAHSLTVSSSTRKVSVVPASSNSTLENEMYSSMLPTDSISLERPATKDGATSSHNPVTMDVDGERLQEKKLTEQDISSQVSGENNANDTTASTFEGRSALPTKSAIETSNDTLLFEDFVKTSQSVREGTGRASSNLTATSHVRTSPVGENYSSTMPSVKVQVLTAQTSTSEPAYLSGATKPATFQEMLVSNSVTTDKPASEPATSRQPVFYNITDYTANFTSTVKHDNLIENVSHTFDPTVSANSVSEDFFVDHENNTAQFPDDVYNTTTTPSVSFTDESAEYNLQDAGSNSRNHSDTAGEVEGTSEVHHILDYETSQKSHEENGPLEGSVVTERQTLAEYSTPESVTETSKIQSATGTLTEPTPEATTILTATELHKSTNQMLPVTAVRESQSSVTDTVPAQTDSAVTAGSSQTLYSEPDVNVSSPTQLSVPTSDSFADHTMQAVTKSHTESIQFSVSITDTQSTVSEVHSTVPSVAATINVKNMPSTLSEELSTVPSTAATIKVTNMPSTLSEELSTVPSTAAMNVTNMSSTLSEQLSTVASTAATMNVTNMPSTLSEELSTLPSTAATTNITNIPSTLSKELSTVPSTAATIKVTNMPSTLSEELSTVASTVAVMNVTNMPSILSEELSTVPSTAATTNITNIPSTLSEELPTVASTAATMNVTKLLLEKSATSSVINTTDSQTSTPHPLSTVSQNITNLTSRSPASTTCVPLEPPRSPSHEFRLTFETSNDFSWEQVEALESRIQLFLNDTPCSKNFARTAFALGPPHVLSWTNPSVNSSWCDQVTVSSIFYTMTNHPANIPTQAMIDTFLPEFHVISVQLQLRGICLESSASSLPAIAGGVVGIALSAALLAGLLTLLWKMLRMTSSRKLNVTPPPEDSFDLKQRRPVLLPGETKAPTSDGTPQKSPRAKPNPPFVVDTDFCYINPNFLEAVKPSPPPPPPYRRPLDRRVRSLEAVLPSRPNTTVGNRSLGGEPTAELEELNCTSSSSGVESDVQHSGEGGK